MKNKIIAVFGLVSLMLLPTLLFSNIQAQTAELNEKQHRKIESPLFKIRSQNAVKEFNKKPKFRLYNVFSNIFKNKIYLNFQKDSFCLGEQYSQGPMTTPFTYCRMPTCLMKC